MCVHLHICVEVNMCVHACGGSLLKRREGISLSGSQKEICYRRHLLLMQEPHVKLARAVWMELELDVTETLSPAFH